MWTRWSPRKMYDAGEICLYRGYTHTGTCTCSSTQYPPRCVHRHWHTTVQKSAPTDRQLGSLTPSLISERAHSQSTARCVTPGAAPAPRPVGHRAPLCSLCSTGMWLQGSSSAHAAPQGSRTAPHAPAQPHCLLLQARAESPSTVNTENAPYRPLY